MPISPIVIGVGATGAAERDGAGAPLGAAQRAAPGPPRAAHADDQVLDLLDRVESPDRRDRDPRLVGRQLAARDRDVVRLQDADRLLHRHAGLGHLLRVERDDQPILEAAGKVRRRNARDRLELGDDLGAGDLGRFLEIRVALGGRPTRRRPARH